jgi:MFS family permease
MVQNSGFNSIRFAESVIAQVEKSPFKIRNIRLFIAFRVFFNSRFYYPIFTILFLDFGLTLQQFALLNVAWAAAIVLFEVPSGALADTVGRKNLLVFTGVLMVVEIALLCFVPKSSLDLLFAVFLVNRVLSGIAEAAASGADEAIAFDTLKQAGQAAEWPRVLEKLMRMQSIAYMGAMSLGAAVYDPSLMQHVVDWLGINIRLTQEITLRFPLYLTLAMAILTLLTTLRMQEINNGSANAGSPGKADRQSIAASFRLTIKAGRWILKTPFALVIILMGLLFDNCIRMLVTLISQYYRLIHLPEASFGLISSGMNLLGLFIPLLALKMVRHRSPRFNLSVMAGLTLMGLIGVRYVWPLIGLLPVVLIRIVMYLQSFFQSHYLNRITGSDQRATVLSFKGLSFNLAYGLIGVLYSMLLAFLRDGITETQPALTGAQLENMVFIQSLAWFPWYFIITLAAMLGYAWWKLKETNAH